MLPDRTEIDIPFVENASQNPFLPETRRACNFRPFLRLQSKYFFARKNCLPLPTKLCSASRNSSEIESILSQHHPVNRAALSSLASRPLELVQIPPRLLDLNNCAHAPRQTLSLPEYRHQEKARRPLLRV